MTDGLRRLLARVLLGGFLGIWAGLAQAADSAVVLMYQRFDDPRVPSANTRLDQLDAHISELRGGGYTVWGLPRLLASLAAHQDLPDRMVAITIDDARANVYRAIWPRLRAARLPFTLFVATDEIDRGTVGDYLTWDQLRELQQSGLVTIGSLGAAHAHYPMMTRAAVAEDLKRAADRFTAELGAAPTLLAWPFGEMSRDGAEAIAGAGFQAAFGQHSGAVWSGADQLFLPRFGLNETYGEIERFRLAARALALPAVDVTPDDPKLGPNPPNFGFTLAREVPGAELLACYASHEGRVRTEALGPRIEVRMSKPFPPGRGRINCTIPTLDGRWRWFGWQFSVN